MVQWWGQGIVKEQINVKDKIVYHRQMDGVKRKNCFPGDSSRSYLCFVI